MVEIQIEDKKYEIPTQWKDITLNYWCGMYSIIKKYTDLKPEDPAEMNAAKGEPKEEIKEPEIDEVKILKMNKEIFIYLTGITAQQMNKLDLESVNKAIEIVGELMEEYKPQGIDRFTFQGDIYYFPKEFLKRNTFGDYIESTQLEATLAIMKHGKFDILPEQMAILCRKAGEEYNDDVIPKKTDTFKELTMDIVWEFSFFFDNAKRKINKDFPNVFGEGRGSIGTGKSRVSTVGLYNKFIKPYGWLNSLYMVAEKGIFREAEKNDVDSVKYTNLYKVLTYLSWNTAKNDYEIAVQDKIHNPNKIK